MIQQTQLGSSTRVFFASFDMHFYGLAIYHISGQKNAEKAVGVQEWKLLLSLISQVIITIIPSFIQIGIFPKCRLDQRQFGETIPIGVIQLQGKATKNQGRPENDSWKKCNSSGLGMYSNSSFNLSSFWRICIFSKATTSSFTLAGTD